MTNVAQTSIENHYLNIQDGVYGTQHQKIIDALTMDGPMTRRQLVNYTGMEVNAVSGRCNELIEMGSVEVDYKGKCPISERQAEFLNIAGKSTPFPGEPIEWVMGNDGRDNYLESGQFRIYNRGKKGGNQYCLYRWSEEHKTFCYLKGMGTLRAMQDKATEL